VRAAKVLVVVALLAVGCGKGKDAPPASEPATGRARFDPVRRPPVSAACAKARRWFGYAATCAEVELPELETAAGRVVRLHAVGDPTMQRVYALVRPSGEVVVDKAGSYGKTLAAITQGIDLAATPPAMLASLYETLATESAIVRCLPGSGDALPTDAIQVYREVACEPPARVEEGDKTIVTYLVEAWPDPQLLNRYGRTIWLRRLELEDGALQSPGADGVMVLDPGAPRPPGLPPVPEMTTPPDWVAPPEKAPAELGEALCAAARARIYGLAGQRCEAYGYPAVALPTGTIYYLANDAGQRYLFALRKPDGAIVVGHALDAEDSPLTPIVRAYDPAVVPAETFLAAHLLLSGKPARILCRPGAGDEIPGVACQPPRAHQDGDDLVITAILHELPIPGARSISDPAVRSIRWRFPPAGGMHGSGMRLLDLREEAPD
jgi:hypothetical protein